MHVGVVCVCYYVQVSVLWVIGYGALQIQQEGPIVPFYLAVSFGVIHDPEEIGRSKKAGGVLEESGGEMSPFL